VRRALAQCSAAPRLLARERQAAAARRFGAPGGACSEEGLDLRIKMRLDFERWADSGCSIGEGVDNPMLVSLKWGVLRVPAGRHGPGNRQSKCHARSTERPLGFAFSG